MNDLQKALETTEATIEALQSYAENIRNQMTEKKSAKCKQWSPVGGDWHVSSSGEINKMPSCVDTKDFGTERPTEQQAERAAVEMRRFNRLLALRDELCRDDLPNWESEITDKWRVYRDNRSGEWNVGKNQYMQDVGVYFTTQEHAERACDMLNSGEVVL